METTSFARVFIDAAGNVHVHVDAHPIEFDAVVESDGTPIPHHDFVLLSAEPVAAGDVRAHTTVQSGLPVFSDAAPFTALARPGAEH